MIELKMEIYDFSPFSAFCLEKLFHKWRKNDNMILAAKGGTFHYYLCRQPKAAE